MAIVNRTFRHASATEVARRGWYRYAGMSRRNAAGATWVTLVVASVVALALGFSACGSGSYRYFKSSDSSAYFKVPAKWTAYNTRDLVLAEAQVNEQLGHPQSVDDMRLNAALNWRMGFDSSPNPSPINVVVAYSDKLVVDFRVRALLPDERQNLDPDHLRNLSIPVDELAAQQAEADKGKPPSLSINKNFEVRVNQEIAKPGGFHGLQTIVNVRAPDPDNRVFVFNQIVYLDANNTKLYVLSIHCETICYAQNQGTVQKIVSSLTLQGKKK